MDSIPRIGFLLLLAIIGCVASAAIKTSKPSERREIPAKFLGSWKVAESENFENYLEARGFGWLMRQLILYSPVTKVFEKSLTQEGTYNAFILTPTKDARWYGWTLGKPFEGLYIDDDRHEITFDYDPETNSMLETHKNLDKPSEPIDVIKYEVNDKGRLIMTVEAKGVVSRRFYNKQDN